MKKFINIIFDVLDLYCHFKAWHDCNDHSDVRLVTLTTLARRLEIDAHEFYVEVCSYEKEES